MSIRHVMASLWLVAALMVGVAHAAPTKSVIAHGVELEVPAGWVPTSKGTMTLLGPKGSKARAIQVVALPAMPAATADAIGKLLGEAVVLEKVAELERDGVKAIVGTGKVSRAGGPALDLDMLVVPTATGAALIASYIKGDQDPVLREANAQILRSVHDTQPRVKVTAAAPKTAGVHGAPPDFIIAMKTKLAPGLDKMFRFPRPLTITFEECGTVNAFYDPKAHAVRLCHEIFDDTVKRFTADGRSSAEAVKKMRGTLVFVFFHELSHALVGELGLPITGRGEDAADELATLLLSKFEVGKTAALDAAELWNMRAQSATMANLKYWDDHSLAGQRVITIMCLLYGAEKARYQTIMKKLGVDANRLAKCSRDYLLREKAWMTMLAPHLRKPRAANP